MARKELIQYVDDVDGSVLEADDVEVVHFSLDGKQYRLDVSKGNAEKFRELLRPYMKAGNLVVNPRRQKKGSRGNSDTAKIRQWARDNGIEVSDRGVIREEIVERYRKAHTAGAD